MVTRKNTVETSSPQASSTSVSLSLFLYVSQILLWEGDNNNTTKKREKTKELKKKRRRENKKVGQTDHKSYIFYWQFHWRREGNVTEWGREGLKDMQLLFVSFTLFFLSSSLWFILFFRVYSMGLMLSFCSLLTIFLSFETRAGHTYWTDACSSSMEFTRKRESSRLILTAVRVKERDEEGEGLTNN